MRRPRPPAKAPTVPFTAIAPAAMNAPISRNCGSTGADSRTNCGRNASMNRITLGLVRLQISPSRNARAGRIATPAFAPSGLLSVRQTTQTRNATPSQRIASNAAGHAAISAASPNPAASACSSAPTETPNAAASAGRGPAARPCPRQNIMSGPGVRISASAAGKKAKRSGSMRYG